MSLDKVPQHYASGDQNAQNTQQSAEQGARDKMHDDVFGKGAVAVLNELWNKPLNAGEAVHKSDAKQEAQDDARHNAFNTLGLMDIYGQGKNGEMAASQALNQEQRRLADVAFNNRLNGDDNPSHSGLRNFRDGNVSELNFNNNPHLNTQGNNRQLAFAS